MRVALVRMELTTQGLPMKASRQHPRDGIRFGTVGV